jgi:hypothetical protein
MNVWISRWVHAGGHTQWGGHQQLAPHIDLSDLVQPSSTVDTPEPSADAFDLFSDLALPNGDAEAQHVTVQVTSPLCPHKNQPFHLMRTP